MPIKENPFARNFIGNIDGFIVLYSGNMGASHDIDSMLGAALILRDNNDINFIFIGEGDKYKDIERFIHHHKLTNVALFTFQPENMIKYTLPLADISLVSLDQGMEDLMIPSKSFYYLAAGSALIAIANDESELSDLIDSSRCGALVPPGNPNILAETIENLTSNSRHLSIMKTNAREIAENRYSREICTSKFSKFLRQSKLLQDESKN